MKHLGQTKDRKLALTIGLRIMMTKSVKTLRMRGGWFSAGPEQGGASNKYTFRKVQQIVFSQGFASAKCMYFRNFASYRKYSFAEIFRFRKLLQIWFLMLSRAFEQICNYGFAVLKFASFHNLWFRKLSQVFARIRKWTFARIRQCKNHGFSQGFAMGTLLMSRSYSWAVSTSRDARWKIAANKKRTSVKCTLSFDP